MCRAPRSPEEDGYVLQAVALGDYDLDVRIGLEFKGLIDDVRIYDRVLSDEEVMALFKLQSDRPLPKPGK